jgi:autotransporter-associated beta strand protein
MAVLGAVVAALGSATALAQLPSGDLRLWLKADSISGEEGSRVSQWVDSSSYGTVFAPRTTGNANGLLGPFPVEEYPHLQNLSVDGNRFQTVQYERAGSVFDVGDPAVDRSGSSDRLFQTTNLSPASDPLMIPGSSDFTSFTVFRTIAEPGALGYQGLWGLRGNAAAPYQLGMTPQNNLFFLTYDAQTVYPTSAVTPTNKLTIFNMSMTREGAEDKLRMAWNITESATASLTPLPLANDVISGRNEAINEDPPGQLEPFGIGTQAQDCCGEGETFAGNFAEIIIYARKLTEAENAQVYSYLTYKYLLADLAWTGGAGTWNGTNTNWDASGSSVVWDASKRAVFSGTGGTVAVGGVTASNGIRASASGYTLSGGTLTLGGNTAADNAVNVASGVSLTVNATLAGTTGFVKTGDGTLILNQANTMSGPTTVQAGVVQLSNAGALAASSVSPVAGGTVTLAPYQQTTVGGLNPNAGGVVDVGNGMVTVAGGLSAATMLTAIQAGYNGGTWTGTSGITSTTAAASSAAGAARGVGWLDNGGGSVTFAFATPGDTNLDGLVDVLDAAALSSGGRFNDAAVWSEGDFNYDGIYDDLDNALYVSTSLFDAGPYNAPPGTVGAVAAVPEPGTLLLAGMGLVAAGARRLRLRGPRMQRD